MNRLGMVVTDIDHTITDASGRLDLDALKEICSLESNGISVGLASGRPYLAVRLLGDYLGVTGPLIAENGGISWRKGQELQLGDRAVAEAAAVQLSSLIPLIPAWDNAWRMTDFAVDRGVRLEDLEAAITKLGVEVELHVSSIMIHIGKRGTTKAAALLEWLARENVRQDEVLVAGDSSSDLTLFRAFRSSIAVGSGCAELARIATYTSKAFFGSGFVEGVRHFRSLGRLPPKIP